MLFWIYYPWGAGTTLFISLSIRFLKLSVHIELPADLVRKADAGAPDLLAQKFFEWVQLSVLSNPSSEPGALLLNMITS